MYDQDKNPESMADAFFAGLAKYLFVYGEFRIAGFDIDTAYNAAECTFPSRVLETPKGL